MASLTLAVSVDWLLKVDYSDRSDCSDCLKDCDECSEECVCPFTSVIKEATEVISKNKSTDKAIILITK